MWDLDEVERPYREQINTPKILENFGICFDLAA